MASPSSWEFYKEEQTKILWVHICTQDLTGVAISINKNKIISYFLIF